MKLKQYLQSHRLAAWCPILNQYDEYFAGWGRKKSFFKAQQLAQQQHGKALCLEDGFIRSLGLGKAGYPPLSIVADDLGIYFDAHIPSRLEHLIEQQEDAALIQRSILLIEKILKHGITKYNQRFTPLKSALFSEKNQNILVVDQTYGDQSIQYAGAQPQTFKAMLTQACHDHPHATIWVKTHPDVLAGKSKAHFESKDLQQSRVRIIAENYNPIELLQHMDEVYVVSSQLGFEALLCGKKVHCFGVPWYAGWGLTDDLYAPLDILQGRRGQVKTLLHLFASAYLQYAMYLNPVTLQTCSLEEWIEILIPNIHAQKHHDLRCVAYGFSPWKKKFIREFMDFPQFKLRFQRYLKPQKAQHVVAWGKKAQQLKQLNYQNVTTVEDGFIRSVGLGAALIRPCSLVFDDIGIYYDATQPSRIENLLNHANLSSEQVERAEQLKQSLIALNISKYNVGQRKKLQRPEHHRVILVVGQVEDDMSIQLGGVDIKTNLMLLQTVRAQHPESYIIYKPHPDVQTGLRIGKIAEQQVLEYANQIELDTSILECFDIVDEVHTISSLSGFEALIRGLKVYCYGLPFYAGWGLTEDIFKTSRRCKNVNLATLIYITLVEYPTYNLSADRKMGVPLVRPEDTIAYIQRQLDQSVNKKYSNKRILLPLYNLLKKLG
jgi:capsular polysaccharide export protein